MAQPQALQENTINSSPPAEGLQVDVVVVGGGFSGVQAAWDVHKAGLNCVLLEARNRIGGRSYSHQLSSGKGIVELGATWINDKTQPKVYETARRLGLELVKQHIGGDDIMELPDGTVQRITPDSPEAEMMQQLLLAFAAITENISKDIDIHHPETFSQEKDMTVETWLNSLAFDNPMAVSFMQLFTAAIVGREISEVGLHYVLDYIKSGGGLISLHNDDEQGAQYLKTKQGTSAIASGLVSEMPPGSVFLNSPVNSISQTGTSVEVQTTTGSKITCRKVIIAIPTNTYKEIQFSPPLPDQKQALVSQMMPGIYGKVILSYPSAWWREAGLSGRVDSLQGPISFSWDMAADDGSHYSLGIFIVGATATAWYQLDDSKRKEAVLDHLARLVGPTLADKARDVLEINYVDWMQADFIWGAPTNSMGPGVLSQYGSVLREPFDNIHFAGGDTSYEWKGYLEGALGAGSRAADEVIRAVTQK